MTQVLVVGATGLLGSTLCPVLEEEGFEVYRHGRTSRADLEFDACDSNSLKSGIGELRPDVIINLACISNVDLCNENMQLASRVNGLLPKELLDWIQSYSPGTQLIQISTDHVYDGAEPQAESEIRIYNAYAMSKLMGELAANAPRSLILRTNFFGKSRNSQRTSFSDWAEAVIQADGEAKLITDVIFNPLRMERLSQCISSAIRAKMAGLYNLGARDAISKRDFVHRLAKFRGCSLSRVQDITLDALNLKVARPKGMWMDVRKFETDSGLELPSLDEELYNLVNQ